MDSWMYQTVGHNAIEAIAECMEVRVRAYRGREGGVSVVLTTPTTPNNPNKPNNNLYNSSFPSSAVPSTAVLSAQT